MRIKYYLTTFLTLLFVSSLTFAQTSFTWKTVGTTGFSDGAIQYSSIVIDSSGTPSVAYVDGGAPGSGYADYPKVRKFNGTGWANAAPNVIDNNMSDNTTWNTSLAVDSGGKLYLAFKDVYKTGKITVKSDNNGVAWGNVGQQGITPGSVEYISLAVNSSGTPYVAYQDGANSSKASVMKWTGTGWSNVGTAGFSAGNANFTSLAFDNSGTPYLAFQDLANSYKATVMKFNGTNWVVVGTAGFSAGGAYSTSLAFDVSGTPYVAYRDNGNGGKATVMKFDGTNWVNVVSAGFSNSAAYLTSLAINDNGMLYVAFQDNSSSIYRKATVMQSDGVSAWTVSGTAGFSAGQVAEISLAVQGTGLPYISYRDNGNGGKTTVMQLVKTADPVITNNTGLTLNEGATVTIDSSALLTTDTDTEPGSLTYTVTTPPYYGEIQKSGILVSSFTQDDINNGLITYVHDGSENFSVWFAFIVSDGTFQSTVQQFTLTVTPVNDAPVIVNNNGLTLNPGISTATIDTSFLSASDAESDAITFIITTLPTNGTLQNNGTDIALNGTFTQTDLNNSLISYTHDGSSTISDNFTFSITDGTDSLSNQVFNITIIDKAWEILGTTGFSAGGTNFMSMKLVSNGLPYVAYMDGGNSNKATVMKFDGSNWVDVGTAGFSPGFAYNISLALDSSGTPYVAFKDGDNSYNLSVMKWNGAAWVNVGSAGFAPKSEGTSIAIDGSGTPYVAYKGAGYYDGGSVMKYDGSNWVTVGGATFSSDQVNGVVLAIDGNGTPFVAYRDGGARNQATVKKLNGSTWETVGIAKFTAGEAGNINLVFDGNDIPYITYYGPYNSATDNSKATVMKFDGTNWVNVGTPEFSVGTAYYPSLAIDGGGTPYVAFKDGANSSKVSVMKYDGTNWIAVGGAGISDGSVSNVSFAIDSDDALFVSYTDAANSSKATVLQRGWTKPNQAPSIELNTGLSLNEGSTATIDNAKLKATDADSDDGALVFTITTATTNGEVQLSGTSASSFMQADIDSGNVTYVHNGGETTSDSFTFSVSDGTAELSGQTFSITVTPVNDAPVVTRIPNITFPEDSTYTIDLDDYASDADNALSELNWSVASVTTPPAGSIVKSGKSSSYLFIVSSKNITSANETKTSKKGKQNRSKLQSEEAGGELGTQKADSDSIMIMIDSSTHIATFTATLNYNIADVPFVFTATDTSNASGSDTTTVTVTPVNDSTIIAVNAGLTLDEGATAVIDNTILKAADVDTDNGALVFTITTATTNGEVQLSGTSASSFTQADIDSGNVTYVHNGGETTSDEFTFSLTDGFDTIFGQTFTITITSVNDIPVNTVAPVISGTAMEEHELSVDNGSWTDADSDSLSYTYQWYSDNDSLDYNGTAITDAVNSTYMLTSNEVGNYVYAEITADDGNGGIVVANSEYTLEVEMLVSVDEKIIPTKYSLSQNYPNPFNPSTNFKYGLKEASEVVFEVYNIQGRKVKSLVNERQSAGYHTIRVDMSDLASGVYLYRLRAGNFVKSMKMILLK